MVKVPKSGKEKLEIIGLGPKLKAHLRERGIVTYEDLAKADVSEPGLRIVLGGRAHDFVKFAQDIIIEEVFSDVEISENCFKIRCTKTYDLPFTIRCFRGCLYLWESYFDCEARETPGATSSFSGSSRGTHPTP